MNKIQKIITLPKLLFVCLLFVGNLAAQFLPIATVSTALFLASNHVYAQGPGGEEGEDEEDDEPAAEGESQPAPPAAPAEPESPTPPTAPAAGGEAEEDNLPADAPATDGDSGSDGAEETPTPEASTGDNGGTGSSDTTAGDGANGTPTVTTPAVEGTAGQPAAPDAPTTTADPAAPSTPAAPSNVIVGHNTESQWASVLAADPTVPQTTTDTQQRVYDAPVAAYTLMPRIGMELGYSTLGTLHERRGENQILSWERCDTCSDEEQVDGQTWVKVWGKTFSLDGKKRLDFATKMYGIKVGHDFSIKKDDKGGHSLTGLYLAYSRANSKFYDQYYAVQNSAGQYILQSNKYTGKGRSELYALGLTHTRYHVNGGYLDLVGQLHWLRGYSVDNQGEKTNKQRGKGFALSAEVGKPIELKELNERQSAWFIEPQAQLIYQYMSFNRFADAYRSVAPESITGLRGRLGVRLAHNRLKDDKTRTLYAVANIWHNFNANHSVRIGTERVGEKYANTWGEVGVGLQRALGKQTYLYGDVRYEFSFKNHAYEAYRGTIGIKYTWK
ncbi:autotransporter outer membrane beta-barrel domain-containing protein [Gallibacterium trehalosifermentans]|uniref:Autotransporter outer membrane beta-barrel domain-containing protein n=1 Tax=Gallibacterium trehalosifermentans TaxID=516935 RepID=A0ABV6H012_9PAST